MSTVGTELFPITGKIIIIKGERRFPEEAKCAEMNEKRQQAAEFLREYAILCRSEDVMQDGKRYHHILNPADGYPVESNGELGEGVCSRNGYSVLEDGGSLIVNDEGWVEQRPDGVTDIYSMEGFRIKDAALDSIYRMMTDGSAGAAMVE
ncbi:MAG: hypothetical protein BHW37_01985 [Firmicutes bacterium CAG:272_52_7]|nr:MAG: hypothetical protein BHW37_01985 [Firmicutes bacterium CAG:272_52_7]